MEEAIKVWNVLDILKVTEELFKNKNITNPRLNAELLLAHTLQTGRMNLYLNFDKPLNSPELADFRLKVKRRMQREPLQYILGKTEFYGLEFKVNPNVLIPRQETELLVDKALEVIKATGLSSPKILDIGTGCGCISVAIASKIDCEIHAIDNSPGAIEMAVINSGFHETSSKITFSKLDIFTDIVELERYDIIISNPPYIPVSEMQYLQPEVKNFEPVSALSDGNNGTGFYQKIFELAAKSDKPLKLLMELGDGRSGTISNIAGKYPFTRIEIFKDLIGIQRVLYIEK